MGRAPCCDKANVKKGPWSPEEDAKLKSYIEQQGTGGNWIALPQKIGLKRCGKSCRLRWLNYLRPNIKHGGFSEEEDNIICSLYISIGSRWSIIAAQLPGRTDNDIKNYWNTRLKKKLLGKQQARRPSKQEARIAGEGGSMNPDGGGRSRSIYWPEQQHVNTYQVNPGEHRANNDDHAAIKRLLVKLGGRFSSNNEATLVQHTTPPPPPSFDEGCSTMTAPMIRNPNGFAAELGEWLHGSSVRLEGLDCFYEPASSVGGGGSSLAATSMNWSEVSPLIYPTLDASYQGMQQCLLEEQMQLGTQ